MSGPRRRTVVLALVAFLAAAGPGCNEGDTVTTPALAAACSATPTSGPAPLVVAFALSISGAEGTPSVAISYGDGASGTNPDATHTYTTEGVYTASFNVTTAGQSARCAVTVTVGAGSGGPEPTPTPPGGENQPPEAVFKTTPDAKNGTITGTAPFDVRFNMCPTADPEGDPLYFTMDFDDDGHLDVKGSTGAACRHDTTYAVGTWEAQICVTDTDGVGGAYLHAFQCKDYKVVANP
jgi:PKD repeat protein